MTKDLIIKLFSQLRHRYSFDLGINELLAALRMMDDYAPDQKPDDARDLLTLLWCKTEEQKYDLEQVWGTLVVTEEQEPEPTPEPQPTRPPKPRPDKDYQRPEMPDADSEPLPPQPKPSPEWSALPVRAPFVPAAIDRHYELETYFPVSRRTMAYAWRYLRRLVPDGPYDVLDVPATVADFTRQGFFVRPVLRRKERNHARLLLLIDQGGSMVPMHRFSRDLVETALYESDLLEDNVMVFYFHNVPVDYVYTDPHLTLPVPLENVLYDCDAHTNILIVSDAGAARGYRKLKRIRTTTEFLFKMKQYSHLIAWLNPIPPERWAGSSAQIIGNLVGMFAMDEDGLASVLSQGQD